jgi:hypothetical protein
VYSTPRDIWFWGLHPSPWVTVYPENRWWKVCASGWQWRHSNASSFLNNFFGVLVPAGGEWWKLEYCSSQWFLSVVVVERGKLPCRVQQSRFQYFLLKQKSERNPFIFHFACFSETLKPIFSLLFDKFYFPFLDSLLCEKKQKLFRCPFPFLFKRRTWSNNYIFTLANIWTFILPLFFHLQVIRQHSIRNNIWNIFCTAE